MSEKDIDNLEKSFELMQKKNGIIGWYADELSLFLEYTDFNTFKAVVRKARASADQSGFDSDKDFIPVTRNGLETYKLTRFAVLLCVMFADDKKSKVAKLKVFLSKFQDDILTNYEIDRIHARDKLTHGEKYMTATASQNGLKSDKMGLFKDAGFKGMYNMGLKKLKTHKGVSDNDIIYDYMGLTESAANTFRTTQTAEHIKNKNLYEETQIIKAAEKVGKEVREIIIMNTGEKPENLKLEQDIKKIRKKLKETRKSIQKIDNN